MNDKERQKLEDKILAEMRALKSKIGEPKGRNGNEEPYDKDAARRVIESFINSHPEKERFLENLKDRLNRPE